MTRAGTHYGTARLTALGLLLGLGVLLGACSAMVKFKDPPEQCGNGVRDPWETCDGTDLGEETCQQHGFSGGTLSCSNECQPILDLCNDSDCGNQLWEDGEDCDWLEMGFASCQTLGHAGGELSCHTDCTYNEDACTDPICGDFFCDVENGETNEGCTSLHLSPPFAPPLDL